MKSHYRVALVEDKQSFFVRHARLLSFVGAFIVFGTFIIKDALRDTSKDLLQSLSFAQASFALRSDNNTIIDKIDQVDSRVNSLAFHQSDPENPISKRQRQTRDMLYVGQEDNIYSWFELDRIAPIVKSIPDSAEFKKRVAALDSELDALRISGNSIVQSFHNSMHLRADPEKDFGDAGG